jgi:hypothetical protein
MIMLSKGKKKDDSADEADENPDLDLLDSEEDEFPF